MGREGWWALRSVRLSVDVCLSMLPARGQRRVARWWPREGALWPGKGHERQHWARTVGSWQRPRRRSVSQKPKDRRSRSQRGGSVRSQSWVPHGRELSGQASWPHWSWSSSRSPVWVLTHLTRRRWTPPPQGAEHWPQGPTTHCVQGCVLQDRVLLGLSASSHRPGSGQVTRRCCSPPPQASEHSLQEEVYQLRQGWAPQGRRAGGWAGPGWQWKGRSGRRCLVSTHCTSRTEVPPPQLREHLLQLPACQVAQGRR